MQFDGVELEVLELALVLPYLPAKNWGDVATDRGVILQGGINILRTKVMSTRPLNLKLCKFLQYLEDYWHNMADIVSVNGRVRKTSNVCEACNRRAKKAIGIRPSLWEMLGNNFCRYIFNFNYL